MEISDSSLDAFRKQLEEAARPLIFFDDDADGLASYLLCQKRNSAAFGVRAARGPELSTAFVRRVDERAPDLIIILDKPRVSREFFEQVQTPTIWIDHHDPSSQEPQNWNYPQLTYLNPQLADGEDRRPVTYWVHRALGGPAWIAAAGAAGDWDTSLVEAFNKEYPDLDTGSEKIEDVLYKSLLGAIVQRFNFALKGRSSRITKNISVLTRIESPQELLEHETPRSKYLHKHYDQIRTLYERQLRDARKTETEDGLFVHLFGDVDVSLVTNIANELLVRKQPVVLIVGRREGGRVKFSMRSHKTDLRPLLQEALQGVDGYGGGHKEACGGSVAETNWDDFLDAIRKQIRT